MALSSVPLRLGTRRRLVLFAAVLAFVALAVLLSSLAHSHESSSSPANLVSLERTAAYIARLISTGATEVSHPVNNEWEGGIGSAALDSISWQRGRDGDLVQLHNGTTVTYRNPL